MLIRSCSNLLLAILFASTATSSLAQKAFKGAMPHAPVAPAGGVPVYGQSGGKVYKLLVKVNDRVKKGQLLAIVEGPLSTADRAQAKAMSKAAVDRIQRRTAELNQKVAQLNGTRSKAAAAKVAAEKNLKAVQARSTHTSAEVAKAKLSLASASKHLASIDAEIDKQQQTFVDDRSTSEAYTSFRNVARFREKARLKGAKKILAPIDGSVSFIAFAQGQSISGGKTGSKIVILSLNH